MRFLVAPEARWVTAQTIYVNGGMIALINWARAGMLRA
jgi:NAD(P)-dependent dehydrogenase (short-subunit alcohol dehydrogenase family)